MQDKVDICIVGGGVVGLFCALLLARAGKKICVIDKGYAASSRYNIGEVAPCGSEPEFNELIKLSQEIWQSTAAGEDDDPLGVTLRGRLEFCVEEIMAPFFQEEVEKESDAGFPTAFIKEEKLSTEIWPDIRLGDCIIGGKFSPEEPVIATKTCLSKLKGAVVREGVKIWGTDEVEAFIMEGDKVTGVKTAHGDECLADTVIIAGGVFVRSLMKKLEVNVPLRPARCHIMHVTPNDTAPKELMILRTHHGHIYMKMNRFGRMMLTYDGLSDPNQATYSIIPDAKVTKWMLDVASALVPSLYHAQVQEKTTVLLSVTPDYLPCIGFLPNHENVFMAVGMGGRSFALSAGIAKHVTDMLTQGESALNIKAFSPSRLVKSTWETKNVGGGGLSAYHSEGGVAFADLLPEDYYDTPMVEEGSDKIVAPADAVERAEVTSTEKIIEEKEPVEGVDIPKNNISRAEVGMKEKNIEQAEKEIADAPDIDIKRADVGMTEKNIEQSEKIIGDAVEKEITRSGVAMEEKAEAKHAEVGMTEKKIERAEKEIRDVEEKEITRSAVTMEDKKSSYEMAGSVGFKDSPKKATVGKLGG